MKEIFNSVIRKKVRILIKALGMNFNELVINLPLSVDEFDSIEWDSNSRKIYLHIFNEDLEFSTDFDDLSDEVKLEVYNILYKFL
jgi:hypothetical protein